MKKNMLALVLISSLGSLASQEVLLSATEQYYDFLALDGFAERPYLNYRTLSDSKWKITGESGNIWAGNNLGTTRALSDRINFRVYGPDLFTSFNSAAPYGQNDGALWQGKGLNSSLTGGVRFEGYGVELTLKPTVVFSQNLWFEIMPSAYDSEFGYIWGYAQNIGMDAPQRFGDDPFVFFSWGDSEIRYTWKDLTAGFGTQNIWLGPGRINSIMHSNNAAPYPKADIGFRRTNVILPMVGWYLGDLEGRVWAGYLSESGYFDQDDSNNQSMISGLSVSFSPSVLPGLSLFANRTYLSKWEKESLSTLSSLFFVNTNGNGGTDIWDQRASLGFDYLIPQGGIEVYGEAGVNDYGISSDGYIRYPFHSMVYTTGIRKSVLLTFNLFPRGEFLVEWTNLELSQDFQFQWGATFYGHHQVSQGFTNEGQWLGAGNGTGGNSQYLGFKMYNRKGNMNFFVHRQNPDNDYLYVQSIKTTVSEEVMIKFKAVLSFGCISEYYITDSLQLKTGFIFSNEHNPLYNPVTWDVDSKRYNFRIELGLVCQL